MNVKIFENINSVFIISNLFPFGLWILQNLHFNLIIFNFGFMHYSGRSTGIFFQTEIIDSFLN